MYINSVQLSGRLAADPMYFPNTEDPKKNRAWFRLAVNRIGQDKADFICCTAWGKKADVMAKYGKKGKVVAVEGSLRENNKPSADGKSHENYTEVSVRLVHLGPDAKQQAQPGAAAPAPQEQAPAPQAEAPAAAPMDHAQLQAIAAAIAAATQASAAQSQVAPSPMPTAAPGTF